VTKAFSQNSATLQTDVQTDRQNWYSNSQPDAALRAGIGRNKNVDFGIKRLDQFHDPKVHFLGQGHVLRLVIGEPQSLRFFRTAMKKSLCKISKQV
jgi:hypothetical protein